MLCNMLRPFTTLPLRQYAQQLAAQQVRAESWVPVRGGALLYSAAATVEHTPAQGRRPHCVLGWSVVCRCHASVPLPCPLLPCLQAKDTSVRGPRLTPMMTEPVNLGTAGLGVSGEGPSAGVGPAGVAPGMHPPYSHAHSQSLTAEPSGRGGGPGACAAAGAFSGEAGGFGAGGTDAVLEARAMTPMWMAKIAELAASWYRDHVSWQVRGAG